MMDSMIRRNIDETCGAEQWKPVTTKLFPVDGQPFQIFSFENDVECNGQYYRCVIIERYVYDAERPEEIDYGETLYEEAWPL